MVGCELLAIEHLKTAPTTWQPFVRFLQTAVISTLPTGVVALMDLLASPREVLRNEALVLLVGLCSRNEEVAKIAAFEGAFERLLGICHDEGGLGSGGVVVQDALELLNNLLTGNTANQRLFR